MQKKKVPTAKAPAARRPVRGEVATKEAGPPPRPEHSEAYEAAVREYGTAIELLQKGDYPAALERFKELYTTHRDETVLAERARTYAAICARKLAPPGLEPETAEELYYLGVVRTNEGRLDEALRLLERAIGHNPASPSFLYARAAARALQANTEGAVSDLRQAISIDPALRYQAANDPDFEKIRDEAVFIDVIEPTPEDR